MKILLVPLVLTSLSCADLTLAQTPLGGEAVSPQHYNLASHPTFPRTGGILKRYIAEKTASGEIDPTEYQQIIAERQALRAEIKSLRQAGDEAALQEKLAQARQLQGRQRDYRRRLIENDPELERQVIEQRQQVHRWRMFRRQEIQDKRLEDFRERRRRDQN